MPSPIIRRGHLRPPSELEVADAPLWVEVENADGTPGRAPYGAGGGGSPWDEYGYPDWRYDFTEPSSLDDWTALDGTKASAVFKSDSLSIPSGVGLRLGRSVPNVPFVFDVRYELSWPSAIFSAEVYCGITGSAAPDRRLATMMRQNGSAGVYSGYIQACRIYNNFTSAGEYAAHDNNALIQAPALNAGVTLRIEYQGTFYISYACWGDPSAVDYPNSNFVYNKASWPGDPVGVWFGFNAGTGLTARCLYAQFQTTNVGPWAGM